MDRKLGKLQPKLDERTLKFARFAAPKKVPPRSNMYWKYRTAFPLRTFGNTRYGDCTRASQAQAAMRMERLEARRTPQITDEEVIRVYLEMTRRLYGGEDTGAYELDALSEWRRPETTFRDTRGRPLTIAAYTKIAHTDMDEIKAAIAFSGLRGIKMCFNLPSIFEDADTWHVPAEQPRTTHYTPGSWGGHSTFVVDYDLGGVYHPTTWGTPDIYITWQAVKAYCDEAYLVIDDINSWKKRVGDSLDVDRIVREVNDVSSYRIAMV